MRIRFTIKNPKGVRKTFAVVRDTKYADGTRQQITVEDEAIVALNRNLTEGLIGLGDASLQIGIIKSRLERQAGIQEKRDLEETVTEHNLTVFRKFWTHLTRERQLKNPISSRNDLLAAMKAVDPLSLTTATRDELMDSMEGLTNKRFRRHAIRINQLLKFLGREITIPLKKVTQEAVHFIEWGELKQIIKELPSEESRVLAQVLFCTGVRLGEAFVLNVRSKKANNSIWIEKQLTHKFETREIKNEKPHFTVLLPQGHDAYEDWCAVKPDARAKLRNTFSNQLLNASRKVFADKERQISAHDLRHSYAIYMLGKRATVTEIASLLGDTEATIRRHYTGWVMTDTMVDNINKLLK